MLYGHRTSMLLSSNDFEPVIKTEYTLQTQFAQCVRKTGSFKIASFANMQHHTGK